MGERSNIFVRIRAKENTKGKKYTYGTFFGLYYPWCYGERMISRLRSAIDFAEKHLDGWHGRAAVDPERTEKFKRYLAINFDMRDIVEPTDLIPYTVENLKQGFATPGADIFAQEENHGYIYVDISLDDPDRTYGDYKAKVKYAFVDYEAGPGRKNPPVRSVENFADHDMGEDKRKWFEPDPYWDEEQNSSWGPEHKEDFLSDTVPACRENIDEINKNASVMSEEERKDFVRFGRRFTRNILKKAAQEKETCRAKRENFLDALLPGKELSPYARDALIELVEKSFPKPLRG